MLRVRSLVWNDGKMLSDGLEAECNKCKKRVPAKQSNTSNMISHIVNAHKGPFQELFIELDKQMEARKVYNQKRDK